MNAKAWQITLVLVLLGALLAGCGTAAEGNVVAEAVRSEPRTDSVLSDSYEGALPVSSQLALGTFQLVGTGQEVTPEQAQILLPLWQVIESGALKSEGETGAVLRQIEGAMTAEQLAAIARMQLTFEDMTNWARAQGVSVGGPGGGVPSALPEGMTQEQIDEMRAARAAGDGGLRPHEGVSEEGREAMRAAAEANGMTRPDGAGSMGGGQLAALAGPLVELLSNLAGG